MKRSQSSNAPPRLRPRTGRWRHKRPRTGCRSQILATLNWRQTDFVASNERVAERWMSRSRLRVVVVVKVQQVHLDWKETTPTAIFPHMSLPNPNLKWGGKKNLLWQNRRRRRHVMHFRSEGARSATKIFTQHHVPPYWSWHVQQRKWERGLPLFSGWTKLNRLVSCLWRRNQTSKAVTHAARWFSLTLISK